MGKAESGATKRKRRRIVGWSIGGVLVVAAGAYTAAYLAVADELPVNTTIHGVSVGGLSRDDAVTQLRTELGTVADPDMTLSAGSTSVTQKASEWGLIADLEASVDAAKPARSLNPVDIWNALVGGQSFGLVPAVDDAKVSSSVSAFTADADTEPENAGITIEDGLPSVKKGIEGVRVDEERTRQVLVSAFLVETDVTAAADITDPDVTTSEAEQFLSEFVQPALSGPVTLIVSGRTITISAEQIGGALKIAVEDSALKGSLDYPELLKELQPQIGKLDLAKARNASFTFTNGKPTVVPSQDGVELTAAALEKAVGPVLAKAGAERKATAEVSGKKPELTTEQAKELGIKEVIGEFRTEFPGESYRFTNIGLAAKGINGSLILQGKTWSLNDTLGERTTAKGYVAGSYIEGSTLRRVVGGGISQSATTTFNAAFFAGLEIVEHHPHTLYFSRYPAGREATVSWGSLDLKVKNNTKYGVLMQAYISRASNGSGSITVRVWSTKTYDVKSSDLRRSNYYYGSTRYDESSNCVGQGATPGFDVNYERLFYSNGSLVKSEPFFWRYDAGDRVICGKKPEA
jgi:vancomycin resistance protein YoaR